MMFDFDKSWDRSERNFWRAFWVIVGLNVVLLGAGLLILVLVLKHFGIL